MKHIDKKNDFFRKYEEIRSQTLKFHLEFDKRHINFMCKKGCSDCCESFSLLPVEYYYIKSRLCKLNITNSPSGDNKCVFLKESECLIYDLRPLMCITQGLPLLIRDEISNSQTVFICEKNTNLIRCGKGKKYRTFEYDVMLTKLTVYNTAFCGFYNIPDKRININELIL